MNQDNNQSLNEKINKLVLCIQDGDKDAFSELYDILINPLYRYLYFSIDRSNIDDVAMTIFIKVWEKISKYNVKKDASFKAWFFRLAKNTVIDFYRSNKITYELPEYMPDTSNHNNPEFQIKETLKQEKLKFCISKLNENYRHFLNFKFLNELSNKEIAEILKKRESSLRVLQYRSLAALKKVIEENGGIDS